MQKKNTLYFIVEPSEEQYQLNFGKIALNVHEKYDLYDDAVYNAAAVIKAMAAPASYQLTYKRDKYQILLNWGTDRPALFSRTFLNSNDGEKFITYLSNCFSQQPGKHAIMEYSWTWKAVLNDNNEATVRTATEIWHTEKEALAALTKLAEKINNLKLWKAEKKISSAELFYAKANKDKKRFIDISAFKIDINDTIIDKPRKFTYDLLDKSNSFKITPLPEFDTAEVARVHCCNMLALAADKENFKIIRSKDRNRYKVVLQFNGKNEAISATGFATRSEAEKELLHICNIVNSHCYHLNLSKKPETWKFLFQLGYDENKCYWFHSNKIFKTNLETKDASSLFHKNIYSLILKITPKKIKLKNENNKAISAVTYIPQKAEQRRSEAEIKKELEYQLEIANMTTALGKKQRGDLQAKAKIVNARLAKYRNIATNVLEQSKGNLLAAKLQSFLSAGEPNVDTLDKLVAEIIQNKKPVSKAIKILNRNQQLHLLQAAICYYLDKVCFNGKDEDSINVIQKVANRMIKAGIDMQSIYNYWNAAEVEKYVPGIDTDFIRQILTGKKRI